MKFDSYSTFYFKKNAQCVETFSESSTASTFQSLLVTKSKEIKLDVPLCYPFSDIIDYQNPCRTITDAKHSKFGEIRFIFDDKVVSNYKVIENIVNKECSKLPEEIRPGTETNSFVGRHTTPLLTTPVTQTRREINLKKEVVVKNLSDRKVKRRESNDRSKSKKVNRQGVKKKISKEKEIRASKSRNKMEPSGCLDQNSSVSKTSIARTEISKIPGSTTSCEICKKCFTKKRGLEKHRSIHESYFAYSCNVCNKRFRLPSYVVRHHKVHEAVIKDKICKGCYKGFPTSLSLRRHLKTCSTMHR